MFTCWTPKVISICPANGIPRHFSGSQNFFTRAVNAPPAETPMIPGDMRQRPGFRIVVLLLLALFAVSALLCAMRCGSRELSYARIIETLWNADGGTDFLILYYIRLPRVVLGAMVGASLALSGAILQGVMRNPLASPGIIGVSAGGRSDTITPPAIYGQTS